MSTITGVIRALPDDAPRPEGVFIPLAFSVSHAKFIADIFGARLVWWRGQFCAVAK